MSRHQKLLEPLRLEHVELKNRIVKAPYSSTGSDDGGYVNESCRYHYDAVARGGVGLFITESVAVDPLGVSGSPRMAIWNDSYIPGQQKLAAIVHQYDTPILMQIHHAGPSYSTGTLGHWSVGEREKLQPVSASALTAAELPGPRRNLPRAITIEEIDALVQGFGKAAERAANAGFDGVELHFATGFLANSFFSRAWNKRDDAYGGSIENRTRFATDIVRTIRRKLGERFVIGARFNGIEYGARYGDGISTEEGIEIARRLETAGVDLLHVTAYGYNNFEWILFPEQGLFPEAPKDMRHFAKEARRGGPLIDLAEGIKKQVSIPIIAVGKFNFDRAEQVIRRGQADLVAFARPLIADPDAPNKLRQGKGKDIRACSYCMTCVDALGRSEHERCRVNATFGKEHELRLAPATAKRRILVIGGGPAGMEAARVAALRGHAVSLYERSAALGGLLPLAQLIKGSEVEDIVGMVKFLKRQLRKLDVSVVLNSPIDVATVQRISPDAVVVATGSKLEAPSMPGINDPIVISSAQLQARVRFPMRLLGPELLGKVSKAWLPIGKRVVVIGGLMQGVELAEFLVRRGREVTVTEESEQLGTGLLEIHRGRLIAWLKDKGVRFMPGVKYEHIARGCLTLVTAEGLSCHLEADSIVVIPVRKRDSSLSEELVGQVAALHVVGDCSRPGMIVDAIESGYRAGNSV